MVGHTILYISHQAGVSGLKKFNYNIVIIIVIIGIVNSSSTTTTQVLEKLQENRSVLDIIIIIIIIIVVKDATFEFFPWSIMDCVLTG